jgi:hypothetical protein
MQMFALIGSMPHRQDEDAGAVPRPSTCRAAAPGTVAGGAIGREALDAGTVASGASIKPDEPGEALHREALDAGDVPRSSTCRAAAPGPMPVERSAARPSMPAPPTAALAGEPPATTTARMPASTNVKDQSGGSATARRLLSKNAAADADMACRLFMTHCGQ